MATKRGKSSAEVCALLEIPYEEMMRILRTRKERFPVEIEKGRGGALIWDRRAIAALRNILTQSRRKETQETLDARLYREAISELGKVAGEILRLGRKMRQVHRGLKAHGPAVFVKIHTLPGEHLRLLMPLGILVSPAGRAGWKAALPEARLATRPQKTREQAVVAFRELLVREFERLSAEPKTDPDLWGLLGQLIARR